MKAIQIGMDVVREAAARKFVIALAALVTLLLTLVVIGLKADVVDGALAATRLFGRTLSGQTPREILEPLFRAAVYVTYYLGLPLGILATADLAPRLLAPGRVEFLLSLPAQRSEILLGTFLGVFVLASAGALYGACGLTVILFLKTGFLNLGPLEAALLAGVSFIALYAAMLTTAVVVRSAAASGGVGLLLFLLGIVAGHRREVDRFFEAGLSRTSFDILMLPLPKISALAEVASALAAGAPVQIGRAVALGAGTLAFAVAVMFFGTAHFLRKDY